MSPLDELSLLADCIRRAFDAVGCRIAVEQEDDTIIVRDLHCFIEAGNFVCVSAYDESQSLFKLPLSAFEGAAGHMVMHVLKGLVARAIENR